MRVYILPALAVVLVLAACAGRSEWSKQGAEPAAVDQAFLECRGDAREATAVDHQIDQDIQAASPLTRARTQQLYDELKGQETRNRYDAVFDRCMRGKGFTRSRRLLE